MRSNPSKSTFRKIEEGLGIGLITGALVFIGYALPFGSSSGWASLPYLAGFSAAFAVYFALSQFARSIPKPVFYLGLLVSGLTGGLVSFTLSPRPVSIWWYLIGGTILFILLWFSEMRNQDSHRSA